MDILNFLVINHPVVLFPQSKPNEIEPARGRRTDEKDTNENDYKECEILPIPIGKRLSRPSARDKLWPVRDNYKLMKSSLPQA